MHVSYKRDGGMFSEFAQTDFLTPANYSGFQTENPASHSARGLSADYIGADGKTEVLYAYIRPANNQCLYGGKTRAGWSSPTYDFYSNLGSKTNMQLWRNLDINNSGEDASVKWALNKDLSTLIANPGNEYVRTNVDISAFSTPPVLKFYINTRKFAPGDYNYYLVSLDKMREKLHLMSKYEYAVNKTEFDAGNKETPYNIEQNLNMDYVFGNIYINIYQSFPIDNDPIHNFPNPGDYSTWKTSNSPIVTTGTFTATSGSSPLAITISSLKFKEADPKDDSNGDGYLDNAAFDKPMTDFVLVVKP